MSEIVPFLDAAAKRASDALAEQKRAAVASGGGTEIGAIENILHALEGMQTQLQALTELVVAQDARIERLEKAKPGRIIVAR